MAHLDIEIGLVIRQRFDDAGDALDVADVIGAEHVDQLPKAALEFVVVIGHVRRKIRVAAIGTRQRAIDIIAERCRTKQRLFAVFPILGIMTFRLFEAAHIDVAALAQIGDRVGHFVDVVVAQAGFREEHVVPDVERGEIFLDGDHHHVAGRFTHNRQPLRFAHVAKFCALRPCQRFTHRHQIVAGIATFGDRDVFFAERLAVARERRLRQHVDLTTGIVDVVFPRH